MIDYSNLGNYLTTEFIGKEIHAYDYVSSTQDIALEMIHKGMLSNGSVIIAKEQTKGKGRKGRTWVSPPGGLWFSIVLRNTTPIEMVSLLPIMTGLCICKSLKTAYSANTRLKWPNDVISESGEKIAGVLIESSSSAGNHADYVVIGVGVNIHVDASGIDEKIRSAVDKDSQRNYGVGTIIPYGGKDFSMLEKDKKGFKFLADFFCMFERYFEELQNQQVENIINEWVQNSDTIGRFVNLTTYYDTVENGKAIGIDENGFLILQSPDGSKIHINAAEIQ